jgi:protein subunit release factor B
MSTKELLFSITKKDFKVNFIHCPGHGGQNVNKVETDARIVHPESGAVAESCEQRTQYQNKKIAFNKLIKSEKFQIWFKKKCGLEMMSKEEKREIERKVDGMMKEENLKIEYYNKR